MKWAASGESYRPTRAHGAFPDHRQTSRICADNSPAFPFRADWEIVTVELNRPINTPACRRCGKSMPEDDSAG